MTVKPNTILRPEVYLEKHLESLYGYAYICICRLNLVDTSRLREEIVHDVIVGYLEKKSSVDVENYEAFFKRLIWFKAIEYYRARKKGLKKDQIEKVMERAAEMEEHAKSEQTLLEEFDPEIRQELSPELYKIFKLKIRGDGKTSNRAIAKELQISPATIDKKVLKIMNLIKLIILKKWKWNG